MTSSDRIIPRHEPELIEAKAERFRHGDTEKVATTSLQVLVVRGVKITSRYGKANEFELMEGMILALPERFAADVASIWCDSKSSTDFRVTLRRWDTNLAREIGSVLEAAAIKLTGGHNGIHMTDQAEGFTVDFDPYWHEL